MGTESGPIIGIDWIHGEKVLGNIYWSNEKAESNQNDPILFQNTWHQIYSGLYWPEPGQNYIY
jgi:hypothetical protein